MSYYAQSHDHGPGVSHASQFEYLQISNILDQVVFVDQHDLMSAFYDSHCLVEFENLIESALRTNQRLILCLDRDPTDVEPFVDVLRSRFRSRDWFVLGNDFSMPCGSNTAPWPYFLTTQQFEKNLQLGRPKQHRIGLLSGVPRPHRLALWQAIKPHVQDKDVVVINNFVNAAMEPVAAGPLPWSNSPQYIDQDQSLTCAGAPTRNDHPAFNAFCCINAETVDDTGPLFFSEKTWKSYISGCLTINYGPLAAPKWLAAHGVEMWEKDLAVSNKEKISIIADLFQSDSIQDMYYENLPAVEYNQHLVDSRAFLHRVSQPSVTTILDWLER